MINTKSKQENEIKDVSKSIRNSTWGNTLWSSCIYFNNLLAENWLKYCEAYSNFELKKTKNEITLSNLKRAKEKLSKYIESIRNDVRKSSKRMTAAYSDYIALEIDNNLVKSARKYKLAQKRNDTELLLQFSKDMEDYNKAIKLRSDKKQEYESAREYNHEMELKYKLFMEKNKDKTRHLTSKIKKIQKLVDKCKLLNNYDFEQDKEHLYEFFKSQRLAERLLITTHSILNKLHGYSFKTIFSNSEKERVVELYFDHIMKSRFNFDYIIACYSVDNEKVEKISDNELVKTIYNGYFLTLKGGLSNAFYKVLNERKNTISLNETIGDDNDGGATEKINLYSNPQNRKSGFITDSSLFKPKMILNQYVVDDATKNYWTILQNELLKNTQIMSDEFCHEYMIKYNLKTQCKDDIKNIADVFANIIKKINSELMSDRTLGIKLAHIIVDTIGGVENRNERVFFVDTINKIMRKHICKHFMSIIKNSIGSETDIMFSEEKTQQLFYQFADDYTT